MRDPAGRDRSRDGPARRCADAGLSGSRVVAQLLTLMDDGGVEARRATDGPTAATTLRPAVVATTNRPNALDPALRRPGRFDVEVEISLPSAKQRLAILRVHARALPLARDVDLEQVARSSAPSKGHSGADLAALCREAAMASIRDAAGGRLRAARPGEPMRRCEEVAGDGSLVTARHFSTAAGRVGASVTRGAALEFSATTWDDVGGLDDVKKRLKQAVEWPLRHAAAPAAGPGAAAAACCSTARRGARRPRSRAPRRRRPARPSSRSRPRTSSASTSARASARCAARSRARVRAAPTRFCSWTRSTGWSAAAARPSGRVLRRGRGRKHRERRRRARAVRVPRGDGRAGSGRRRR